MPHDRHDLGYREATSDAERCGKCRHLTEVVLPNRLGICGVFKALGEDRERWNLLPDIGLHMLCDLFESKDEPAAHAEDSDVADKPVRGVGSGESGEASKEVALAGRDGQKAAELLKKAKKEGTEVLADITRRAIKRLLSGSPRAIRKRSRLFVGHELKELADALAATTATADLLGRSRIRLRQRRANQFGEQDFDDDDPPFAVFDESAGIQPFAPEAAIDYFQSLVPELHVDPDRFGAEHRRDAFTLANQTDKTLLDKVKGVIGQGLKTGQVSNTSATIQQLLDELGVAPANPQYADMVFRTNAMDAYNTGSEIERRDPEVMETFPVWRYLGIEDGRQGKDHEPHFGNYYPASVSFGEVRGPRVFNCRCTPQPVSKWQWAKLKRQGARIADGYQEMGVAA